MLALLTVSCEDRLPVGVQVASKPCMLGISSNTLSYSHNDTIAKILKVESENVAWKIKDVPSWLTVSPASGNSNANVTVRPSANNVADKSRVAMLKFVSESPEYQYSRMITVDQHASSAYINPGETSLAYSASSATKVIAVDANVEWTVSCSDSWVSATIRDGSSVAITVTENLAETRSATVSLLRKSNSEPYGYIHIKQAEAGMDIAAEDVLGVVKDDLGVVGKDNLCLCALLTDKGSIVINVVNTGELVLVFAEKLTVLSECENIAVGVNACFIKLIVCEKVVTNLIAGI